MNHARDIEFYPGNGDNSWYHVSLALQDGKIIVHYECFSSKRDEEFKVADVQSRNKLYAKFWHPLR